MESPSARRGLTSRLASVVSSLSFRLFLSLTTVIVLTFGGYAYVSFRTTSEQWNKSVMQSAERAIELIRRSTHYGMLVNRKEDVHHIIEGVADAPGVVGVRIYDKGGGIIFSGDKAEIGTRVDLKAEACVGCHEQDFPLESIPDVSRMRVFEGVDGRVMGLIHPIENAPECANAPCHVHPSEQSILGVLDVRMSMAGTDANLAAARRDAIVAAAIMALLAGLVSALFIVRMVRRPVKQLISGAGRVAAGHLDTEIHLDDRSEMGRLARAFNHMTDDLRQAREELTRWSGQLETRLREKTEELTHTQAQVAHVEKMASLGKLAATVAHELNNPLAGILNYAKLVSRTMREDGECLDRRPELARYVGLIQKEADRSGTIVRNLLTFARPSGVRFSEHFLNPIIERSLMLVRHHLEISDIRLDAHALEGDDRLVCDAGQLEQALVALLVNSAEAMPHGGTLHVTARAVEDAIEITIGDTGLGIPPDVLPHIFEPFFSTKEATERAGLGLAIVYGIVRRHGGRIEAESKPNEGTTFRVVLPRWPTPSEDVDMIEISDAGSSASGTEDAAATGSPGGVVAQAAMLAHAPERRVQGRSPS